MKVTNIYHPFPSIFAGKEFVGCCNGLICIANHPLGHGNILIWNPATKLHKFLQIPEPIPEESYASLGFGYDEEGDDFKVVSMKGTMEVNFIVYSSKLDSWINIHVDLLFRVMYSVNNIVGGAPHCVAKDLNDQSQIVWVDFKDMVCKMVPSNLEFRWEFTGARAGALILIEWKDSVATILHNKREGHEFVKVVAFDKNAKVWNTVHIIGPIELELYSFFKCFNSGKIIGGDFDKKLHVFDPQSGGVKVLEMGETGHPQMIILNVYEYNESLFFIEGMEPMEKKKEQVEEKKEVDEVDPTDPDEEKNEPVEEKKEADEVDPTAEEKKEPVEEKKEPEEE